MRSAYNHTPNTTKWQNDSTLALKRRGTGDRRRADPQPIFRLPSSVPRQVVYAIEKNARILAFHMLDDRIAKLRALQQRSIIH